MGSTTSREVQQVDEVISIMTPSPTGVISHWNNKQPHHHFRQASVRSRASQPISDQNELDKRFAKVLTTDHENEQRGRLEQAALLAASKKESDEVILRNNKLNQKKQQDAVINKLKNKTNAVREKKLLQQDEVYNGALEDILLGLKSEPYRRADAVRRSQRRRIDNNRLSRTMEEIEM